MTEQRPMRIGRTGYDEIPIYAGAHDGRCDVDLSDNTNQWGAPPAASRALAGFDPARAARYPAAYAPALNAVIAQYAGVTPDMVVTGCGSDQVLDCAFRALAEPGERVAYCDPTFVIIPSFARANALQPVPVPWRDDSSGTSGRLAVDADAMLATRARVTYLCTPNNPTGTPVPRAVVERVVREAAGIVIVDEAYFEFADWTAAALLAAHPNLVVTRTLSKAFGLAGLRVGYALGAPEVVREIAKTRGPYALALPGEAAAVAALQEDVDWMRARVRDAVAVRERLTSTLRAQGAWRVYESAANFVLAAPLDPALPDVMAIAAALRDDRIAVRAFPALPEIGAALRITVAPWPVMERLLAVLPGAGAAA